MQLNASHTRTTTLSNWLRGIFASTVLATSSHAIDLVEDFDGASLDTAVWEASGNKGVSVADGKLTVQSGGGNWNSGQIRSQQRFFIPPAGQTTTIEWVLGPATVEEVNEGGDQTVRYQIGILSNNHAGDDPQHYSNTTGGLWVDLDNLLNADRTSATGNIVYADDQKAVSTNGYVEAGLNPIWNWDTDNITYRLELTDTGYTWYENDTEVSGLLWADAGIDTEFANGVRVFAYGQKFNGGDGTTSFESISVTNGFGPPDLLGSFTANPTNVVSNQTITLSWIIGAEASAEIDQEIGNIDSITTGGTGTLSLVVPEVTETTVIPYTLTVTEGGNTEMRTVNITVNPAPAPSLDDFFDHFSGSDIDTAEWQHLGGKSYTVADSRISWGTDADNWGHGEVVSTKTYPIPQDDNTTTITWNLGPANVQKVNGGNDAQAIRPMLGIVSSFEEDGWSRQHWKNSTGGLWLDINYMSSTRSDGVSGDLVYADDTKIADSNGSVFSNFDTNWNWETENQEFSLVLTNTSFTWMAGENELGTGNYDEVGLDLEFDEGFRVMFSAISSNDGRGTMSLDSVNINNGGTAPGSGPIVISSIIRDGGNVTLTWNSQTGSSYKIETSGDLENWLEQIDGVEAEAATRTFTLPTSGEKLFYRVVKE